MVSVAVRQLQPDAVIEALGYVRVSRKVQAEGHSPELQREAIKRLARQEGYILSDDMIFEDHESGSKITRKGYQAALEAVRSGRASVVICYMFDRWGRDAGEWLSRARELRRLGVPLISVMQGKDQGGLLSAVHAGMAEEYAIQLAQRVRPAREKSAREGTHMGVTPYGYKRVYPAYEGTGRRPAGVLVPDEATAQVVREVFALYAEGGWSVRSLACLLNGRDDVPPPRRGAHWSADSVLYILRNSAYRRGENGKGQIRYNVTASGKHESAAPGSTFEVEGQHEGLIDTDVFDRVQTRLDRACGRPSPNRRAPTVLLGSGVFRCPHCGASMTGVLRHHGNGRTGQYECGARRQGTNDCQQRSIRIDVSHDALIAEMRRLRGAPWTPQAQALLTGTADTVEADKVSTLRRELDGEQERLRRYVRRMADLEIDPTPEEMAAFREVRAEIGARIRSLEAQLADASQRTKALPSLRALHEQLTRTEIARVMDDLHEQDDTDGLREMVLDLVQSARLVDRWPEFHSTWARAEVTWAPDVQALIDAGLLTLDEPPARPEVPLSVERARARFHRYYERQKAKKQAEATAVHPEV